MIVRPVTAEDADRCGEILFQASEDFANRHHFVRDYPTLEAALQYANFVTRHPRIIGVVAEDAGRIVGLNFMKEFNAIRGVGPLAVDPSYQGAGVGRALMDAVLERAAHAPGVRLVQVAYHLTSLSLYASLGFAVKEPIVWMQGTPAPPDLASDLEVRTPEARQLNECAQLCLQVHGIDRSSELRDGSTQPVVLLRDSRVVAYLSDSAFGKLGHGVAICREDMQTLISAAAQARGAPVSFLVATRQAEFLRWCLDQGMRMVKPMTLMSLGFYMEPQGCFVPSVQY